MTSQQQYHHCYNTCSHKFLLWISTSVKINSLSAWKLPRNWMISSYSSYVNSGSWRSLKNVFNIPATTWVSSLDISTGAPSLIFLFNSFILVILPLLLKIPSVSMTIICENKMLVTSYCVLKKVRTYHQTMTSDQHTFVPQVECSWDMDYFR